jgi:hypothetical protein
MKAALQIYSVKKIRADPELTKTEEPLRACASLYCERRLNLQTSDKHNSASAEGILQEVFLSKHFGGERFDFCTLLPRVERQSGFAAGLFEKHHSVPVMFDRNLRQEQAAMAQHRNQQTVAADFDDFGRDFPRRSQDAEFDCQMRRFIARDSMESRVFKGRCPRGFCHGAIDGVGWKNVANASA